MRKSIFLCTIIQPWYYVCGKQCEHMSQCWMHVHNSCSTTILTAFTRDFRSRRRNTLNLNKPCHCWFFYHVAVLDFFFTSITSVAFCYHHNVTVFITSFSFVVRVWHGQKSSTQNSAIQFLEQLVTGCNLRVMDEPRNLSSNKYFLMSRNELPYIFISVRSEKSHFYVPSCLNISQWVCTTNYSL